VFNKEIGEAGLIKHEGVIVDATFVEAPKQRNSRDENNDIKNGKTPEGWDEKDICESVEKVFCEKGYRGKPLTELQKLGNKIKSSIRCRIEHISH